LSPASDDQFGRTSQELGHNLPFLLAEGVDVLRKRFVVECDARVCAWRQQARGVPRDLAVEQRGALGADSNDADVLRHAKNPFSNPAQHVQSWSRRRSWRRVPPGAPGERIDASACGRATLDAGDLNVTRGAVRGSGSIPDMESQRGTPSNDPFAQLGLQRAFEIDVADIERAHLARSAMAHPDVSGLDAEEAARVQAELNEARATLEHPESRANALLKLLNGPAKEQDKSLPAGFLAQMMETREEIEAAVSDPAQRTQWVNWAEQQRDHYKAMLAPYFQAALAGDASVLPVIRRELNAWRYIERLVEQLDPSYDPSKADFRR